MRNRWLVGLLLAAAALAVVGGVVAADTGDPPPSGETADAGTPNNALITRVAESLGVDAAALEDAYRQAREEQRAEKQREWIDSLVESGSLTQEEAVEIESWLDGMPRAFDSAPFGLGLDRLPGLAIGPLPQIGDGTPAVHARVAEILGVDAEAFEQALSDAQADLRSERAEEHLDEMLDRLVEDGTLTAEEAGELRQWLDQRPAAADKLSPGGAFGIPRSGCHENWFGFSFKGTLPDMGDGAMPWGGMFRGMGRFGQGGGSHGAIEESGEGFRFEFGDDGIELMPGHGLRQFKQLGPGGGLRFKFHLAPAEEPQSAPAESPAGDPA